MQICGFHLSKPYWFFSRKSLVCSSIDSKHLYTVGRRGRDRMVVGFTASCAISTNHQQSYELELRS